MNNKRRRAALTSELDAQRLYNAGVLWPCAQTSLLIPPWGRRAQLLPGEAMALGVLAPLLHVRLRLSETGAVVTVTWRSADERIPHVTKVNLYPHGSAAFGCPRCQRRDRRLYVLRTALGCRRCLHLR